MTQNTEGMNEPFPEGQASPEPVASDCLAQQGPGTHPHTTGQKATNLRISSLDLVFPKSLLLKGGPVFRVV